MLSSNAAAMEVVVTGIGLASALGSLESSWQGLVESQSGIRLHQPFLDLSPNPLALIGKHPAQLKTLTQQVVWDALQDAGLSPPLVECGVVIGSSRGNQAEWERLARSLYSSSDVSALEGWLETLPSATAITARLLKTCAPVLAPMAACATGTWAIAQGCELIRTQQCQRVVAGAVEAAITPLTLIGFEQMGALAKTGCYPFDRDREGLVLGEGGAILVLESAELAKRRGAKLYGRVLGFGLTADGYHVSAPQPDARSAIAAVQQCLQRSGFPQVGYIHAHGTSTQLNDRTEAQLIQRLFPQGVPVSSTKGATGHTLGASGALGTAFCLLALQRQTLPPCVGLQSSEFDLDLIETARSTSISTALSFSFGFGGQNAAIALSL